jgi:hypothetical protein
MNYYFDGSGRLFQDYIPSAAWGIRIKSRRTSLEMTNSTEWSLYLEADSRSPIQNIHRLLWNPKAHCRVHNPHSPPSLAAPTRRPHSPPPLAAPSQCTCSYRTSLDPFLSSSFLRRQLVPCSRILSEFHSICWVRVSHRFHSATCPAHLILLDLTL